MKLWKRGFAFLLLLALVLTNLSLPAHAQEPNNNATITLDANGGEFSDGETVQTISNGESTVFYLGSQENKPTYKGEKKALVGWSTTRDGNVEYGCTDSVSTSENITLYAIWVDGVTVTFDANGGSFVNEGKPSFIVPKGYSHKESSNALSSAWSNYISYFNYGFEFLNAPSDDLILSGWALNSDGTDVIDDGESMCYEKDTTLYAVYRNKVNVTLYSGENASFNNLNGSYEVQSVHSTDLGLQFWRSDSNSSYHIIYPQGVLDNTAKIATFSVPEGTSLSLHSDKNVLSGLNPVDGKAFLGWSEDATGNTILNGMTKAINEDISIYAVCDDGVKVTLHAGENGYFYGDETNKEKVVYVRKNAKLTYGDFSGSAYTPIGKDSKNFRGWSVNDNTEEPDIIYSHSPYKIGTTPVDLYAVYNDNAEPTSYTVTFVSNGKGYFDVYGNRQNTYEYNTQSEISMTSEYSFVPNDGTAFVGWSLSPDATVEEIRTNYQMSSMMSLTSDVTLYPVVTEGYKLTFDPGDGSWRKASNDYSALMSSWQKTLPKGQTLSSFAYYDGGYSQMMYSNALSAPSGKTLIGWTTVKNDRSTLITSENAVLNANTTLYAFYAEKVEITIDANGGYFYGLEGATTLKFNVEKGKKITYSGSVAINDDHKQFIGWSTTPDGDMDKDITPSVSNGGGYSTRYLQVTASQNATYYAVYGDAYQITYYAGGGKISGDESLLTTSRKIKVGDRLSNNSAYITNGDKFLMGWSTKETINENTLLILNSTSAKTDNDDLTEYYYDYVPTSDMTLYPIWADAVKITLDFGPEMYYSTQTYNSETGKYEKSRYCTFTAPKGYENPYGVGYNQNSKNVILKGFSEKKDGNVVFTSPSGQTFNQDATYYAVYSIGKNVKLNGNGGTFSGYSYATGSYTTVPSVKETSAVYYDGNTYFTINTVNNAYYYTPPVYDGYSFLGWSTDPSAKTGTTDLTKMNITEGMTLYAIWQEPIVHNEFAPSAAETPITEEAYQTVPANDTEVENKSSRIISSIRQNLQGTTLNASDVNAPEGSSVMINSVTAVKNETVINSLQDVITSVLKSTKDAQTTVQDVKLIELNASGSGKVKFLIGKEYAGKYAVVGHYHNGNWTTQQCLVDDYGYITPQFSSFSPIAIMVTTGSNEVQNLSTKEEEVPSVTPAPAPAPAPAVTPTEEPQQNVNWVTMHRLYNPNSGEHFYTCNVEEKDMLVSVGWNYEGEGWTAPDGVGAPVYRLYNPNSGEHHYTTGEGERDMLASIGWNYEGIGWYSAPESGTPLYRLYNPNATGEQEAGAHHYTKDAAERDMLVSIGWNDEGIGWYGL